MPICDLCSDKIGSVPIRSFHGTEMNNIGKSCKNTRLPLVSVITVVYNGEEKLEDTIRSVANQSYENIEYIVIDGGSTDKTLSIIGRYRNFIDYWISETDDGIYDAMNKGLSVASGHWINFMNCSDVFINEDIVKDIVQELGRMQYNCDMIYGAVCEKDESSTVTLKNPKHPLWIYYGLFACHQSIFFRRKSISEGYSLDYKIGSDYDLVARVYREGGICKRVLMPICLFDLDGVSNKHPTIGRTEYHRIRTDVLMLPSWLSYFFYFLSSIAWLLRKDLPKIYGFFRYKKTSAS